MQYQGIIKRWNDDKGFGFVTHTSAKDVFVHIYSFSDRRRRPVEGDLICYEILVDDKQRISAQNIKFVSDSSNFPNSQTGKYFKVRPITTLSALAFLAALLFAYYKQYIPLIIIWTYLIMGIISFLVYGLDKTKAKNNSWRISENTLHLLDLMGGWLGGFFAQQIFNHKSTKKEFLFVFWLIILMHVSTYYWLFFTQSGNIIKPKLFFYNDIVMQYIAGFY